MSAGPAIQESETRRRNETEIHGKPRFYDFCRRFCRLATSTYWRIRYDGEENLPRTGGALVLSNHQSFLDPVLVGVCTRRRLTYLARKTLFRGPLKWLIESLNAIPIDRDGMGLSGLKETLRRLKREEAVVIFPEGTRTPNGKLQQLLPGFVALVRRGRVPLIPVGIDGAYQSWPRHRKFPGPSVVQVEFGEPITPESLQNLADEQILAEVERRMRDCFERARAKRARRI